MEIRRCMKCMHALAAGETVCPECGRPYGSVKAESFALKPGTILDGKYLVGEMLGQGGFGITYLAENTLLLGKVAIKEFFFKEYCDRDDSTSRVTIPTSGNREIVERFKQKFIKEARTIFK